MNNGAILPVIPENITVHLGRPTESARNVTVPFADYIKNVASSEIYPTWPENALRANILAQISFTLNRIYTEYYRSRGYDFDITNSTAFDQSFVYGRDIFENISQIVDEIFNEYVRRSGSVEPLFAVYCDGINVQCNGVSQWGSVELANQGLTPYEILQYYYGDGIELVTDVPVVGSITSYPGTPVRLGSNGDEVYFVQTRLNRISRNYPNIPKIANPNGLFSADTEDAVKAFQRQFNLTPDGIVGSATWYAISRIYTAVKRLADINSEGISLDEVTLLFNGQLSEGSSGLGVRELQVLLAFIAQFDSAVIPVTIDGIFGSGTRASVESFQYEYGLPVTGTVDAATWYAIVNTFQNLRASLPEGYITPPTSVYPGTPLVIGSTGEDVVTLQNYLNRISDVYTDIPKLNVDGIYGTSTQNAVRAYQRIFGLEERGIVGAVTWNSIASTYRTITDGQYGSPTQFGGSVGN